MNNTESLQSFFTLLEEKQIEPNQLYVLLWIKEKKGTVSVNVFQILRVLLERNLIELKTTTGYILEQYALTDVGEELIKQLGYDKSKKPFKQAQADLLEKAGEYNELFPKAKAGSGSYMRSNPKDVRDALNWFMINYPYDWETIIAATARYLDDEERKGYKYTSTSRYFIKKMDVSKTITSKLADWCEIVKNGEDIQHRPSFSEKVV